MPATSSVKILRCQCDERNDCGSQPDVSEHLSLLSAQDPLPISLRLRRLEVKGTGWVRSSESGVQND
jgi:hypothetical protein